MQAAEVETIQGGNKRCESHERVRFPNSLRQQGQTDIPHSG